MAFVKLAALALLAANGPALVGGQELYSCDGYTAPNYDDCDKIMAGIDWSYGTLPSDPPPIAPGVCATWTAADAPRCLIQACNRRDVPQPNNVFNGPTRYSLIKQHCEPQTAGGECPPGGDNSIIAVNNPDQGGPSRIKRGQSGKVVRQDMTLAESEALLERVKQMASPHSKTVERRQSGAWTNIGTSRNVPKDGVRTQVGVAGPVGFSQSFSVTEGFTASIEASVGAEASFFSLFTASVEISVGLDYTNSWTEEISFTPTSECFSGQRGIVYMYPLYDRYQGFYASDPSKAETWWIPVQGGSDYTFTIECIESP